MTRLGSLYFYPERIGWIGLACLCGGLILSAPLVFLLWAGSSSFVRSDEKKVRFLENSPFTFSLGLNEKNPALPIPQLEGELTFSFDPPRPVGRVDEKRVLVRLKKGAESKRVVLPCRVDLEFEREKLKFAKNPSSFWLELSLDSKGQIEAKAFITSVEGEKVTAGNFIAQGLDCPIQAAVEFAEGSPFRLLAESRWWGKDQFQDPKECGERLEIGALELLELKEGDWLIWKDQKWEKRTGPERDVPIAHIQSSNSKALVLEGWDSDGHIRISLNPAAGPPFKLRGEDLFSAIRIRSEKQISCMMEKQCIVLKTGDWVLKTGGRWKILRKKEERDAFLNGKLFGELFVFEQISQKQGQKMIQGRLFNPGRTQVLPIEMPAQAMRQTRMKMGEKRRGKV